jgi:signal peptidase I
MATKIWSGLTGSLAIASLICTGLMLFLFLAGVKPYVVKSGSMEPALSTGSLCWINHHAAYEEVQEGDLVAFQTSLGQKVVHRVIRVTEQGLETKGDANEVSDGISVTEENYLGKEVGAIPKLGYVFAALLTARGKILAGTAVACLVILGIFLGGENKGEKRKGRPEEAGKSSDGERKKEGGVGSVE